MKNVLLIIITCGLVVGCSMNHSKSKDANNETDSTKESYLVFSYLNENADMKLASKQAGVGLANTIGHSLAGWSTEADLIILGSIISLDGAETNLSQDMQSPYGYTLGTLLVQETYKGESQNGQVIKYMKGGGVITEAQFHDAIDPAYRQKGVKVDPKVYVNMSLEQDIQVEEGKTYLLALDYVEELDRYNFIGLNAMSKETNLPQVQQITAMDIDTTTVQVKNNDTGTYEDLTLVLG